MRYRRVLGAQFNAPNNNYRVICKNGKQRRVQYQLISAHEPGYFTNITIIMIYYRLHGENENNTPIIIANVPNVPRNTHSSYSSLTWWARCTGSGRLCPSCLCYYVFQCAQEIVVHNDAHSCVRTSDYTLVAVVLRVCERAPHRIGYSTRAHPFFCVRACVRVCIRIYIYVCLCVFILDAVQISRVHWKTKR